MNISEFLSKQLNEKIVEVVSSGDTGWMRVVRKGKEDSTRFASHISQDTAGYRIVLHDFKTEKAHIFNNINLTIPLDFEFKSYKNPKQKNDINKIFKVMEQIKKPHPYLTDKGLKTPSHLKLSRDGHIAVGYAFIDQPKLIVAINLYNKKLKRFVQGSAVKGACALHRYDPASDTTYVVEGLADALTVMEAIKNANVIECGGVANVKKVVSQLSSPNIIVCGENDSVSKYQEIKASYPKTKVIFPPVCKDINDYMQEAGWSKVKKVLNEADTHSHSYKCLGFLGKNIVLYSKTLLTVQDFTLQGAHEILRLGLGLQGTFQMKMSQIHKILDRVISEAAAIGQYSTVNERGVGLHKYKDSYYYNTGRHVYKISDGVVTKTDFCTVVREDFLMTSHPSQIKDIIDHKFDFKGFIKVLETCDWEYPCYAKLLAGFLVQSVYAGVTEMSPHLWIESSHQKAGKSWLTKALRKHLTPDAPASEGTGTTVAGFRQNLRFWSGLSFIDEFGEDGFVNVQIFSGMMQTLRSGSFGTNPLNFGTKQQIPIKIYVKFSAILSCISHYRHIAPQDHERIIFVKLLRKDGSQFLEDGKPLWDKFFTENKAEGFLHESLQKFHIFQSVYDKYVLMLNRDKPELGHKIRGFASVLAGYYTITEDEKDTLALKDDILQSKASEVMASQGSEEEEEYSYSSFNAMCDIIIGSQDMMLNSGSMPLWKAVNLQRLAQYGIILKDGKLHVYNKLAAPLLKKHLKLQVPAMFFRSLEECDEFIEKKVVYHPAYKRGVRALIFKWNYIQTEED